MSEATMYNSTPDCPIALLADEALSIIVQLGTCDLAAIDRLFKVETLASEALAQSREGALFQLGIVNAHVDTILSHVPEHSAELPRLEAIYEEVQKLLYSVSKLLQDEPTEDGLIENYYFSIDPFETH